MKKNQQAQQQAQESKETGVSAVKQQPQPLQAGETVEMRIKQEVQKFDLPTAKLAELKKLYKGIKIFPLPADDAPKEAWDAYQKSYDQVKQAISVVRPLRTGIEAKRKELNADYISIKKGIDDYAKDISAKIAEIEDPLQQMRKEADEAFDKREVEKKEAEERILKEKVDTLKTAGLVFHEDGFYCLENIQIDIVTIKALSTEAFENLVEKVKEISERIKAEKDKEEKEQREKEEAADKLRKENEEKAEQLRKDTEALKKQTTDFRKQQLESIRLTFTTARNAFVYKTESGEVSVGVQLIEEATFEEWNLRFSEVTKLSNEIFEEEQKRLQVKKDEEEKELKLQNNYVVRSSELKALGVSLEAGDFKFLDYSVTTKSLREQSEEEWQRTLQLFKDKVAENNLLKEIIAGRVAHLLAVGFIKNEEKYLFQSKYFPSDVYVLIYENQIEKSTENEWEVLLRESLAECKKVDAKDQEEKHRLEEIEEQKRIQGLNDTQRVIEYVKTLISVPIPELSENCEFRPQLMELGQILEDLVKDLEAAKIESEK